MSQTGLFVALHLIGLAVCLGFGPRGRPALCCALGFPVGLALVVLIALGLLVIGIPYNVWSLGAAAMIPVALSVVAIRRHRPLDRDALAVVACWTFVFAVLCPALTAENLAVMTHDSHIFVVLGGLVAGDQGLSPDVFVQLDEWGVFTVVTQSLTIFTSEQLLYALPLVLGLSLVPVFAVTLWHGLGANGASLQRRALLVTLATVALFTNGMVLFHVAYLHSNMGSAVYLFGFVVLFWLAEVENDPSGLPIAFLFLIALALQRTETPIPHA